MSTRSNALSDLLSFGPLAAAATCSLALLMTACGGASAPDKTQTGSTSTLQYTNPTSSGYRLVKDSSSTSSHLVLSLVGPQGATIKGGVFTLNADGTKAAWASAGGSDAYIKEGSALNLGSGVKLLKSKVTGSSLEAAIYQKGSTPAAKLGDAAILSAALDLHQGATKGSVSLSCPSAQILDANGGTQSVSVAVGSLAIQ